MNLGCRWQGFASGDGPLVASLLRSSRPSNIQRPIIRAALRAVSAGIMTIVVFAVNRKLRRGFKPNITEKRGKIIFPTFAHGNPSSSIVFEVVNVGIEASPLRALPCQILRAGMIVDAMGMLKATLGDSFAIVTTAALRASRYAVTVLPSQFMAKPNSLSPALAPAKISYLSGRAIFDSAKNGPAKELLASEINKPVFSPVCAELFTLEATTAFRASGNQLVVVDALLCPTVAQTEPVRHAVRTIRGAFGRKHHIKLLPSDIGDSHADVLACTGNYWKEAA